jgi:DNA polymerase-3 subunit epsilon
MHKKYEHSIDDNFTLSELFSIYNIQQSDRATAAIEAFNMALLFLKLKSRLNI